MVAVFSSPKCTRLKPQVATSISAIGSPNIDRTSLMVEVSMPIWFTPVNSNFRPMVAHEFRRRRPKRQKQRRDRDGCLLRVLLLTSDFFPINFDIAELQ